MLTCPCDKSVEPKIINGVIEYIHDDGTSCKTLNRFYIDKCGSYAWKMCERAIEDDDADTFNVYMCVLSNNIRKRLLKRVRFASKPELISLFTFLFSDSEVRQDIQAKVANDIVKEYGRVAYFNILAAIDSGAIASSGAPPFNKGILGSVKYDERTKSKMPNIVNELRVKTKPVKQNIVDDLTRSFLMDKIIKDSNFKETLKSMTSGRR